MWQKNRRPAARNLKSSTVPFFLNLLRYQGVVHMQGKLWSDPSTPLASNCIHKNMTLRHLSVWLTHTLHCHIKKDLGPNPLVSQSKGTWLQWYTSLMLSCDFSHIPAPLRCAPPPPSQTPLCLPSTKGGKSSRAREGSVPAENRNETFGVVLPTALLYNNNNLLAVMALVLFFFSLCVPFLTTTLERKHFLLYLATYFDSSLKAINFDWLLWSIIDLEMCSYE